MMQRRASDRRKRAGLVLLALASFGLLVAPVLHAELHAREMEAEAELTRLVQRLALRGADFDEVFAQVWRLGHGKSAPPHSHGGTPAPQDRHGGGTLEHLALALHAAPPPPAALEPSRQPEGPAAQAPERAQLRSWRMPALPQGPPRA
jgi:hypothetical protein